MSSSQNGNNINNGRRLVDTDEEVVPVVRSVLDPPESTARPQVQRPRPPPNPSTIHELDYKAQVNSRSTIRVPASSSKSSTVAIDPPDRYHDDEPPRKLPTPKDPPVVSNLSDRHVKKTPVVSSTGPDAKQAASKHWVYEDQFDDLDYKAQANDRPGRTPVIVSVRTDDDPPVPPTTENAKWPGAGPHPNEPLAERDATPSVGIPIVFLQNERDDVEDVNTNNGHHTEPTTTLSHTSNESVSKVPMKAMVIAVISMLCIGGIVVGGVCGSGACRSSSSSNEPTSVATADSNDTNVTVTTTTPITTPTFAPMVFALPTSAPTLPMDCSAGPIPLTSTTQLYDAVDDYLTFVLAGDFSETAIQNTNVTLCYGYPMNAWDVSRITDFSRVFDPEHQLPYDRFRDVNANPFPVTFTEDLNDWDTSSATNMFGMFAFASGFNGNISRWNLTSVTNTSDMFLAASIFNGDVSNWDVSNVVDMTFMFSEANAFNGDLSRWNTSSVEWMINTFGSAISFQGDLSLWDTSSVRSMLLMFGFAPNFNSDLSKWDVSNVLSMRFMFSNAVSFNGNISTWDVRNVFTMDEMFRSTASFNGDISAWNVGNVTSMELMFSESLAFNADLSRWNVAKVENMNGMFLGALGITTSNLSQWDTSNVNDMTFMFANATNFNGDISSWDVGRVQSMKQMFFGATSFNGDLSRWNVGNVQDMSGMFFDARLFSSDLSNWNVSNTLVMDLMFALATAFNQNLCPWDQIVSDQVVVTGIFFGSGCAVTTDPSIGISNGFNQSWCQTCFR